MNPNPETQPDLSVAVREAQAVSAAVNLTSKDINTLVAVGAIPNGTPPDVILFFSKSCAETRLSPFKRQVHLIKRNVKQGNEWVARYTVQTGIDGYRAIANRTGLYAGNDEYKFDEGINEYQMISDGRKRPTVATATVYKMLAGTRCPFAASVRWEEYYPGEKQGFMWDKMPFTMLGKCAESLALRKAFPEELSGVYTDEEMAQAEIRKEPEPVRPVLTDDQGVDYHRPQAPTPRQEPYIRPAGPHDPAPVTQAAPAPTKADPKRIEALLEESKAKLLRTIQGVQQMQLWVEALRAGWLMQNEQLKAVSAHLLFPTAAKLTHYETATKGIKGDYDKLMDSIKKVAPTAEEEAMFSAVYGPRGASTEEPERPPSADGAEDVDSPNAPWRSFPVPFGQSSGTLLGKLDKKKLYGFFANFEVEETYEGKPRQKDRIERDRQFRAALDSAGAHYNFTLPEDKKPKQEEPLPQCDENGNPI
jgi:phage recombination protein Bet